MHAPVATRVRSCIVVAVWSLVGGMGLCGCEESPADGFERFYEALAAGDAEAAALRLSSRARARIAADNAARGLTTAAALAASFPRSTVRSVRLISAHEPRAVVEVTDALGESTRVAMRREDGRWVVDLDGDGP